MIFSTETYADYFDPFGDYPEVVPVSIAEAVRLVRAVVEELPGRRRASYAALKDGSSTTEARKQNSAEFLAALDKATLRLYRSIVAAPPEEFS